jgi:hypothetical protein
VNFVSSKLARLVATICILAAHPTIALAQQSASPALAVNQLSDAVNAAVARRGGNIRMTLDRCKNGDLGDEVCYFTMSNKVAVKATGGYPDKRLRRIEVELPVDKENTERLYRTSYLFALALAPDISDADFSALRKALAKASTDIMGDALHVYGPLEIRLQLGLDQPRSWWERLFSKEPKSQLEIFVNSPS